MALMTVSDVAEYLQIQTGRVERLARESLLIAKSKDESGSPLFEKDDVQRYKELAERLGGL
ncbi:helix-turn-helix domain-containing protein [Glaciecola sp. 1036]|uniref:helix-turn-helix domain-containing protein n=1 Tax=Alteromonadaceae TaxID=72275 RepID=UPI003D05F7BC